jgi:glycosyltransferase involved in cell wall biosynthesis
MKLAILTCGMLPIPAVKGGAVENLIDFYLEYNDIHKLHDITVYSPWDSKVTPHPALLSAVNHYVFIDVSSPMARLRRKLYGMFHTNEYYNYFIEYYFEQAYKDLKKKKFDFIILENSPGYACKLSQRGYHNIVLHLHNDLLNNVSRKHDVIAKNLTKVLTVSEYIRERVCTICPAAITKTVHNGIALHLFDRSSVTVGRKDIGLSDDDFVIVFSGRMNKDKGIAELVDAILKLEQLSNIKLLALGSNFFEDAKSDDTFLQELKTRAMRVQHKFIFTGFIPYSKVATYLHLADIAVLPSMWEEPFGLTVVEAMAAGLPLVTTRSGGIPEICEGVATIVERHNIVENLSAAIIELYEHPEKRMKMSAAAILRAQTFSKENFVKNFFAAIKDLQH